MPDAKAVAHTTPPVVLPSRRVLEGIYLWIVEGDGYNTCRGTEKGKWASKAIIIPIRRIIPSLPHQLGSSINCPLKIFPYAFLFNFRKLGLFEDIRFALE
jgi:hypothetical protein